MFGLSVLWRLCVILANQKFPVSAVWSMMESPVGDLYLVASDDGLHALVWQQERQWARVSKRLQQDDQHFILKKAVQQLREYFAGKRTEFDLPLKPVGTEFQQQAWQQLRKIPYGKTISYAEQAKRLGDHKKARAVGTANSKNPISIIVPCHRVIASSGALSGFGGGVSNKRYLLKLEQHR